MAARAERQLQQIRRLKVNPNRSLLQTSLFFAQPGPARELPLAMRPNGDSCVKWVFDNSTNQWATPEPKRPPANQSINQQSMDIHVNFNKDTQKKSRKLTTKPSNCSKSNPAISQPAEWIQKPSTNRPTNKLINKEKKQQITKLTNQTNSSAKQGETQTSKQQMHNRYVGRKKTHEFFKFLQISLVHCRLLCLGHSPKKSQALLLRFQTALLSGTFKTLTPASTGPWYDLTGFPAASCEGVVRLLVTLFCFWHGFETAIWHPQNLHCSSHIAFCLVSKVSEVSSCSFPLHYDTTILAFNKSKNFASANPSHRGPCVTWLQKPKKRGRRHSYPILFSKRLCARDSAPRIRLVNVDVQYSPIQISASKHWENVRCLF